jgi:hypothetical protein
MLDFGQTAPKNPWRASEKSPRIISRSSLSQLGKHILPICALPLFFLYHSYIGTLAEGI